MAQVARGTKSVGGGTNFASGTILASEVNTDLNTIVTDYNGNITDYNIAAAAAIETSKIDGYSDTTERVNETSPGTTDGTSDATTLAGELERLRYKIKELGLGSSVKRLEGRRLWIWCRGSTPRQLDRTLSKTPASR